MKFNLRVPLVLISFLAVSYVSAQHDTLIGKEPAMIARPQTPVLAMDSGKLFIKGYLPAGLLVTISGSSKDFYCLDYAPSRLWSSKSLLRGSPELLFVSRKDINRFDAIPKEIAARHILKVLDSTGYYTANFDSRISTEPVFTDSFDTEIYDDNKKQWQQVKYYDTLTRRDFYYDQLFAPVQMKILPFAIRTGNAALLRKYILTVSGQMSGSAEATEQLSHQLVRAIYCNADFVISAVKQEKDTGRKEQMKEELRNAVTNFWGMFPFEKNACPCKNNLYVNDMAGNIAYDRFMGQTREMVLKRIEKEIK